MSGPADVDASKRQTSLGRLGRGSGSGSGTADRVQAISRGPFAVGSVVWRDARGGLVCTLVAKATYELAPGACTLLKDPLPIHDDDQHRDSDAARSVHAPSDLVPFKKAAEVVVVGSAFSPAERPVARLVPRIVVGPIDKSLEVWTPRWFRGDGAVEGSAPRARFSLGYEHAAGGPDTDNPAGIDVTVADALGRRPIPEILPHLQELGLPGDLLPTIGFGPLASSWRPRASALTEQDRAWLRRQAESPLPESFSARFFQAAPPDQWLDRPLAPNERIVLESLHPEIPRLVTSLPAVEPWAILVDSGAEPVRLQGDLLFVDTDRAVATLTFRGQVALDEGTSPVRVLIVDAPMGADLSPDAVRRILASEEGLRLGAPKPTTRSGSERPRAPDQTGEHVAMQSAQALPFTALTAQPSSPRGHAAAPDNALPFRRSSQSAPPAPRPAPAQAPRAPRGPAPFAAPPAPIQRAPSQAAPVPSAPVPSAPVQPPPIQSAPVQPAPVQSAPIQPAPVQSAPFQPSPLHPSSIPPAPIAPPAPVARPSAPSLSAPIAAPPLVPPAPAPSWPSSSWQPNPPEPARSEAPPSQSLQDAPMKPRRTIPPGSGGGFDAAFGTSGKAASGSGGGFDAAFGASGKAASGSGGSGGSGGGFDATFGGVKAASDAAAHQEKAKESAPRGAAFQPSKQPLRRRAVVDLLSFDPEIAPRLRGMKRFTDVWAHKPRGRVVQGTDEARGEDPPKARMDILRVLSCGRAVDAAELRGALADSLEDHDDFDLPLVLVAGELRPTFDEVETLRATASIAQSVAGTEKKILAAVALAQEALAASLPPRPEVAANLTRQIEQATAVPSLPARYVAAQAERMLLEDRKYKRRTLLGAPRVRAELTLASGGDPWLVYLPDTAAASLPLLLTFPVIALCEVRPREDIAETHAEALFTAAFGRVLHGRPEA